jgi:hypothetical protein
MAPPTDRPRPATPIRPRGRPDMMALGYRYTEAAGNEMRSGFGLRALVLCIAAMATMAGPGLASGTSGEDAAPMMPAAAVPERCNFDSPVSLKETADDLLLDRYHLGQHPAVTLPHDLTWTEDPFGDRQWRQKFQQLRYVMALMYRWQDTDQDQYRDRAIELVRSWIAANPFDAPASPSAWKDQVTAWRAMTLVCMAGLLPATGWLDDAITQHGEVLADPDFYVVVGNHALNQDLGLLDVGCYLDRQDWVDLASRRLDRYVAAAIDTQGVSDEQAVKYDRYDYDRMMLARDHLLRCGAPAPAAFSNVERTPAYLAQATRPDGHYETIGDSDDQATSVIPGTPAEYAASLGKRGSVPPKTVALYQRGYAFGRTGWGDKARSFEDEMFFSLRYGPGLLRHGHDDSGGLTYFGNGAQLLVDPGYGDQNSSTWHRYFVSRAAHNAVVAKGISSAPTKKSILERSSIKSRSVDLVVAVRVYPGVTMHRRVIFSRRLGYLIVEDTLSSTVARSYSQLWHLTEDARPKTVGSRTWTRRPQGNLLIQQLITGGVTSRHVGETGPIQGWISRSYGQRAAAPVIEQTKSGTQVRFLTLLASFGPGTGAQRPPVDVRGLVVTSGGFSLTVDIDGARELVRATANGLSITDAP